MNDENLMKPMQYFNSLSPEEQQAFLKKGTQASASKRGLKKVLIETVNLPADEKHTHLELIAYALIGQAESGNIKAIELLRDTIGEKPMKQVSLETSDSIEICIEGKTKSK